MLHSQTNPNLHQNQPSRESIFCGKVGNWLTKRALIMLNFLPKTTQKQFYLIHAYRQRHRKHLAYNRLAVISSTPYIGNSKESTSLTTTSTNGCKVCYSCPTKPAACKRRSNLSSTASFLAGKECFECLLPGGFFET